MLCDVSDVVIVGIVCGVWYEERFGVVCVCEDEIW